jgi:ribose/xylose/arabinose/galactoside ABC-type transport system permease subunit
MTINPVALETPAARKPNARGVFNRGASFMIALRSGFLIALFAAALASPGFLSAANLLALVTTASFVGCVAVGMTLITVSGNIVSFSLGATVSATTLVFVAVLLWLGLVPAIIFSLIFGLIVGASQGFIIGWLGANPIVVSIAAFALLIGVAPWTTDGNSLFIPSGSGQEFLRGKSLGVPIEFVMLIVVAIIGQCLLSFTTFGRKLLMVGSSRRAAEAAGIRVWRTITGAYLPQCRACCWLPATAKATWTMGPPLTTTRSLR